MKPQFVIPALVFVFSATAHSGMMSRTCKNRKGTISFTTFALGDEGDIEIQYTKNGRRQTLAKEIVVNPQVMESAPQSKVYAIPVGKVKRLSGKCEQVHVVRADGSDCYGRQFWNIVDRQTYTLTWSNGSPLFPHASVVVSGKQPDGFIRDIFTCEDAGVTTAGGCYIDDDNQSADAEPMNCKELFP